MIKILPVLLLLASSVFSQTNVSPFRLIKSGTNLVWDSASRSILNHQTYTVTRLASTASGGFGFYLNVTQTNDLVETSIDDFTGFLSSIDNSALFEYTTGYYGSGPYRVVKGLMDSSTSAGGSQSEESSVINSHTEGQEPYVNANWHVRGEFGVPMFSYMRPTIVLSELVSFEINSSEGALTQIQYYEAAPEILNPFTNTVTQSGATADSISGFIAATANWANYSYEQTYVHDYDFTTNGVDPNTHLSFSYSIYTHDFWEEIVPAAGKENPIDSVIWHFIATKEYY